MSFSKARRNCVFAEELYEDWCDSTTEDALIPCESVGRTSLRHLTNRKVEVETADDGSSRRGRTRFIVFFSGAG